MQKSARSTVVNGHKKSAVSAVPVTKPISLQDVQEMIQQSLAAVLQTQAAAPVSVPEPKAKSEPKSVKRELSKPHASEEKFNGNAVLTLFASADARPFSFGVKKARLILALLPMVKAFVDKNDDGSIAF